MAVKGYIERMLDPRERERQLELEDALMWDAVHALAARDDIIPAARLLGLLEPHEDD